MADRLCPFSSLRVAISHAVFDQAQVYWSTCLHSLAEMHQVCDSVDLNRNKKIINSARRQNIIYVLVLLFSYNIIILLNHFYLKIPIFPQVLGFILLTFVPGLLILNILDANDTNRFFKIFLVVGVSIAFNSLAIITLNVISDISGKKLISFEPLIIYYDIILLILSFISILSKKNVNATSNPIKLDRFLAGLILLPMMAVIGSYLLNYYGVNFLNIIVLVLIAFTPFFYKWVNYHPALVWISSISLLLCTHLVSDYLWSWDIHFEYYFARLIIGNQFWDYTLPGSVNSLANIVLLAPMYSIMLDLDVVWVYKLVYCFFYSLVGLGIYYLARDQFKSSSLGYLSALSFLFYYGSFKDMADKQYIAELFLVLSFIAIFGPLQKMKKPFAIVFLIMIPLSHYGVAFLLLYALIISYPFTYISRYRDEFSPRLLLLFVIFTTGWYIYITEGTVFANLVSIAYSALTNLNSLLSPEPRSGISYLHTPVIDVVWLAYISINMIFVFFIFLGVANFLIRLKKGKKLCKSYLFGLIAIAFMGFLFYQITATLNLALDRSLQIALVVLAPFSILGLSLIFHVAKSFGLHKYHDKHIYPLFALFLCIFFIFSSGMAHQFLSTPLPYAIYFDKDPLWNVYSQGEVANMHWLGAHSEDSNISVINEFEAIKSRDAILLSGDYSSDKLIKLTLNSTLKENDSYLFIGRLSSDEIEDKSMHMNSTPYPMAFLIKKLDKIYGNGDSGTYY